MFHCRLWRLLDDVAKEDFEKVAMETWQAQFRRKMGPVDEAIVEVHGKCFWEKMNYISVFLRNLDAGEIWWKYTCIHLFIYIYIVGVLARGIDDILMIKCCEDWGRNRFFHHSSWWNSQNFGGTTGQRISFPKCSYDKIVSPPLHLQGKIHHMAQAAGYPDLPLGDYNNMGILPGRMP